MEAQPQRPRPRSLALNAWVIGAILLMMIVGGVVAWVSWSREAETAAEEAHDAVVQPVDRLIPESGAQPARPPAN